MLVKLSMAVSARKQAPQKALEHLQSIVSAGSRIKRRKKPMTMEATSVGAKIVEAMDALRATSAS